MTGLSVYEPFRPSGRAASPAPESTLLVAAGQSSKVTPPSRSIASTHSLENSPRAMPAV